MVNNLADAAMATWIAAAWWEGGTTNAAATLAVMLTCHLAGQLIGAQITARQRRKATR